MILIVDDKQENLFSLQKLLQLNDFKVDTALSGEEALKKILKNFYALIILDVQMPVMDGFEIAEADLRLRGPGDILGTAQSGLPPLKIGDPVADHELMRLARNAAFLIFERDPKLEHPDHQHYRRLLADTRRLLLAQVS